MNNENRNEEAVSPVIATILMVAITVVLAGVLYVWASSLADDSTGGGLDKYQFERERRWLEQCLMQVAKS